LHSQWSFLVEKSSFNKYMGFIGILLFLLDRCYFSLIFFFNLT
jgi:hypothetical protein